jgi:hypothetical protein
MVVTASALKRLVPMRHGFVLVFATILCFLRVGSPVGLFLSSRPSNHVTSADGRKAKPDVRIQWQTVVVGPTLWRSGNSDGVQGCHAAGVLAFAAAAGELNSDYVAI